MTTTKAIDTALAYQGAIFDIDTRVHERDFEFFKEYLPHNGRS